MSWELFLCKKLLNKLTFFTKTVPDILLEKLALDSDVNKFSKKLQGELIFKLLLYCLLTEKETSLRGMKSAIETSVFKSFANLSTTDTSISHSSISERLSKISYTYFEKIYDCCLKNYKKSLDYDADKIIRFDSTIVTLCTKLLSVGFNLKGTDCEKLRQLKFTIGLSSIPEAVFFYKEQAENSENIALRKSIIAHYERGDAKIAVFDRGITSRANYDLFTENKISFVSRISTKAKHTLSKANKLGGEATTETLKIVKDNWVYLYAEGGKKSKYPARIIEAIKLSDGEPISFITNIEKLSATQITDIYKSRWDIEVFFKFIKQHLNFSHLLSRNENGIKVVLYVTMIAALVLLQFKKQENLKGFKMVKRKLASEIETSIIYDIVIMCGGSPKKAKQMLYGKSP
jgi:hypothetical protein